MEAVVAIPGFFEPFSSLTHLAGAILFFIVFLVMAVLNRQSALKITAITILGFSSVFVLSMSGVYHLLEPPGLGRMVMLRMDHAAIFVMIAGTFTAVHLVMFKGIWRWGVITLVWLLASAGITLKTIFFHDLPEITGLLSYIGFGWLGLISAIKLWRQYSYSVIRPLFYGGLAYSIGATIDFMQQPVLVNGVIGPHEVFHIAVLAGIGLHWRFMYIALDHHRTIWSEPDQPAYQQSPEYDSTYLISKPLSS